MAMPGDLDQRDGRVLGRFEDDSAAAEFERFERSGAGDAFAMACDHSEQANSIELVLSEGDIDFAVAGTRSSRRGVSRANRCALCRERGSISRLRHDAVAQSRSAAQDHVRRVVVRLSKIIGDGKRGSEQASQLRPSIAAFRSRGPSDRTRADVYR
jgi:hypothetical protein